MAVRRSVAMLVALAGVVTALVLGLGSTASAATMPAHPSPTAEQTARAIVQHAIATHSFATPTAAPSGTVHPDFSCSYLYVCGKGANGNSFAYSKCDVAYELPDLVGVGPEINNQTSGTVAYFFDQDANPLFESVAPNSAQVNWSPVWYAVACVD